MSDNAGALEECISRQKKEKKDLLSDIQKLKHSVPKGDKKKKKEIQDKIDTLEKELETRHKKELEEVQIIQNGSTAKEENSQPCDNSDKVIVNTLNDVHLNDEGESKDPLGFKFTEKQKKSNKNQRRKEKKAQKLEAYEAGVRQQATDNLTGQRHLETTGIKQLLSERNLSLYDIPSDGNCLYSAVLHQLNGRGSKETVEVMRSKTADFLRLHRDDFLPFMVKECSGDLYTSDEFEDYCSKIENTNEWGGETEIRALSDIYKIPIEVLQWGGAAVTVGSHYKESPPLILTYHKHAFSLGAHYNSVVTMDTVTKQPDIAS